MKRYRPISYAFDTRSTVLAEPIGDDWEPSIKEQWANMKNGIREGLVHTYGAQQMSRKESDFIDVGPEPFSVLSFHNTFFRQARGAFVIGSYYPALLAVVGLGERILNHLILGLRDSYRSTPEYKLVYKKASFDNWSRVIDTLAAWSVFRGEVVTEWQALQRMRNEAVHFRAELDKDPRPHALEAIHTMARIIELQFGALSPKPWFIPGLGNPTFIKKSYEADPFVKLVYLPNSVLVGVHHTLEFDRIGEGWTVHDDHDYEAVDIPDEEFRRLWDEAHGRKSAPPKSV